MPWTTWLHPLLMLLVVFPAGFAAAALGLQLQQVRTERGARRKVSPKQARERHIAVGVVFLVAVAVVATIGGFVGVHLAKPVDTSWHGIGALSVVILLIISTALVTLKPLKRLRQARFIHSILNGTVIALLVLQFLSGGWIVRQLLRG
ncbi:DUF4079 domain-containing protein [Gloeobacter kilaueensis]|uniref:DUF4079 domain-containing protein n=1 Tax=Gloeobacter kilaueensis (strain ATCC BAA-2537 / CCAP 1431/1 / ULC 316 / JS1) TaxID=1183438 RepID=U5QIQ4_GLOK1|nr:DUF4079 domain-containing protein [Gloeobacter kilaueensis]AGY57499.1 hypothetical protein GKIL_1253 [Gloeobacter kilaueensis JS1]